MKKQVLLSVLMIAAVSSSADAQRRRRPATPPTPEAPATTPAVVPTTTDAATASAPVVAPINAPEATPSATTTVAATVSAPEPVATPTAETPPLAATEPPTSSTTEPVAATIVPRRFALEFGPVIGLNINLSPYGIGPNLGVEVGGRLAVGPGFFAFGLRGQYERYGASGTSTAPCSPAMGAPSDPCISPPPGTYQWNLSQQTVTLGLPLSFRLLPGRRIHPYILVQPQVLLERVDATSFELTNVETATRIGVLGALGVQFDVGPGGLWLEAGFRWAQLPHRSTGREAQLSLIGITIGYRFSL